MAELQGLGAELSQAERAGVEIVAISPDSNEQSQKVADGLRLGYRFLADRDLAVTRRYGLVHAGGGPDGDVPRPATVVLDRDGEVVCSRPALRSGAARVRMSVGCGSSPGEEEPRLLAIFQPGRHGIASAPPGNGHRSRDGGVLSLDWESLMRVRHCRKGHSNSTMNECRSSFSPPSDTRIFTGARP